MPALQASLIARIASNPGPIRTTKWILWLTTTTTKVTPHPPMPRRCGKLRETELDPFAQKLALTFSRLRVRQGMVQEQVVARLKQLLGKEGGRKIAQSYVSKVETGQTNASFKRWRELAHAVGIPPELLFLEAAFEGSEPPHDVQQALNTVRRYIRRAFVVEQPSNRSLVDRETEEVRRVERKLRENLTPAQRQKLAALLQSH